MRRYYVMIAAIVLSYVFSVFTPSEPAALSAAETEVYADSLAQMLTERGVPTTEDQAQLCISQAHDLARHLFPDDREECLRFRNVLIKSFLQVAGKDVAIIHNSGGWGRTPLSEDGQWGPVAEEIQWTLHKWGYSSAIISYQRTEATFSSIIIELKELLDGFTSKAEELAILAEFIAENSPQTKVLITGLSQGAAYTNQALKHLESHERVYAIQAGIPFYYSLAESDNLLDIEDNGLEPDALSDGDAITLLSHVVIAHVTWAADGFDGGPLGIGGHYEPPGHDYHWPEPGVNPLIIDFLRNTVCAQSE